MRTKYRCPLFGLECSSKPVDYSCPSITPSTMHRILSASSASAALVLLLIHTGRAKSTAASTRSASSRTNKERKRGADRDEDASALSPVRREYQCASNPWRTWEAVLFGKVRASCSRKRAKSLYVVGVISHGSRPSTSKSSAPATAKVEEAGRELRRERSGVEQGGRAVELIAGIRGGNRPGGASRRGGAGSGAGRGKRSRAQAPQQRSRDGSGKRRGDPRWDEEEEDEEDEGLYDYDYEDQDEDYEHGAEYYEDESDVDDEDDDGYDVDFGGDFDGHEFDYDDYDEEDDYDDYDAYDDDGYDDLDYGAEGRSRRRKSPGRPLPRQGRGEAIPGRKQGATRGRGPRGRGRRAARSAGASVKMQQLKERLGDAQEELRTKMSSVKQRGAQVIRELKGSISSDLEKTLIKATRPDDDPAKRKHVNLLLQAAEHAFPAYMNPQDKSLTFWREGPYWMTLHKLWRRMAERDYRTASKAVYVLHRVARGTTTESWGYFRDTMSQMRRVEDKGTKSRYFSRRVIRNVDEEGHSFAEWLDSYAEFVLLRLQSFSPDLSELAAMDSETSHEEASRSLEKVERLIEAALACELGPDQDNDVTCDCLKLVVEDLCELWSLFQEKLEIRLQQRSAGEGFSRSELRRTAEFLEFYVDQFSRAKGLVRDSHRLLALYSHAVPRELSDVLAEDMLQEQLVSIQEEVTEKDKAKTKGKVGARKSGTAGGDSRGVGGGGKNRPSSPPSPAVKVKKAGAAGRQAGSATLSATKTSVPSPAPAASNAVSPKKRVKEPALGSSSNSGKASSTRSTPTAAIPPTKAKKMKVDAAAGGDGNIRATSKAKSVEGKEGIVGGEGKGGMTSPASTKTSSAPATGGASSLAAKKVKKKKSSSPSAAKPAGTGGEGGNTAPPT